MTTSPPRPPSRPPSRRFYLPAALLVGAGVERVVAGTRGPSWLLWFGMVLVLAGAGLALAVHRARSGR